MVFRKMKQMVKSKTERIFPLQCRHFFKANKDWRTLGLGVRNTVPLSRNRTKKLIEKDLYGNNFLEDT